MAQDETRVSAWKQPVIPSPRQRQEDCKIGVNMDSEFKASPGLHSNTVTNSKCLPEHGRTACKWVLKIEERT